LFSIKYIFLNLITKIGYEVLLSEEMYLEKKITKEILEERKKKLVNHKKDFISNKIIGGVIFPKENLFFSPNVIVLSNHKIILQNLPTHCKQIKFHKFNE